MELVKLLADRFCPFPEISIIAPAGHRHAGLFMGISYPEIVVWSYWIFGCFQVAWISSTKGEEIDYLHSFESPTTGKTNTATYGRIVLTVVCG